jgi:multiple sugar transport system substrate-binding protein
MAHTRRQFLGTLAGAAAASGSLAFPSPSRAQSKKLTVWWNRGYYKEEDEAMLKIAEEFRTSRNVDLDLSLTPQAELAAKLHQALATGRGPDVAFCISNDWEIVPRYAWSGKLVETTDVVDELRPRYIEKLLPVAYVHDNVAGKRAYYGVPIECQTMQVHYWRDFVKAAGMNDDPARIPMDWNGYWGFWKKAQTALRKRNPTKYGRVYGLGVTESPSASDTLYNFEMALLSFGGTVFSDQGKVVADQSANREAIVRTLDFFADMFNAGFVPPDSLTWVDGDNNAAFHSRTIVMTPNPSVSIPAHQFFNSPDNYFNRSATIEWPDGPDGRKPTYMVAVKTIVIPRESMNRDAPLAKEFVKFVVEPGRFGEYIKGANGRWFPAFKDVAADPFFAKGQAGRGGAVDPHVPVVSRIYLERPTQVFEHYKNPANSQVYAENVWGRALSRTNVDRWPADKAADEAIARVKTIVAQWR